MLNKRICEILWGALFYFYFVFDCFIFFFALSVGPHPPNGYNPLLSTICFPLFSDFVGLFFLLEFELIIHMRVFRLNA